MRLQLPPGTPSWCKAHYFSPKQSFPHREKNDQVALSLGVSPHFLLPLLPPVTREPAVRPTEDAHGQLGFPPKKNKAKFVKWKINCFKVTVERHSAHSRCVSRHLYVVPAHSRHPERRPVPMSSHSAASASP